MHHKMSGMGCPVCGCGMGGGMKAMFMMIPFKVIMNAEELGMSEEQIEAFRNRHSEAKKQMIQIGSQIKINMVDVKNAVMREEIDMQTAEAKIREIGKLKGDKFVAMIQAMNDMRGILSHEQRMKVKEMIMGWMKKGGECSMGMEEEQEGESGEMEEE